MKISKILNSKLVKKILLLLEVIVINPLVTIDCFSDYFGDTKGSTDWLNKKNKFKAFIKLLRLKTDRSISGSNYRCWKDHYVKEGANLKGVCDYCGKHCHTMFYTKKGTFCQTHFIEKY